MISNWRGCAVALSLLAWYPDSGRVIRMRFLSTPIPKTPRRLPNGVCPSGIHSWPSFSPPTSLVVSKLFRRRASGRRSAQPLQQVISDSDRIGYRSQGRVHRTDADKEARVHDVEIVELM